MNINPKTLEKLSAVTLLSYAGIPSALSLDERRIMNLLSKVPVVVNPLEFVEGFDNELYNIAFGLQGRHDNLMDLRASADHALMDRYPGPGFRRLSILFDGIYLGEPEDLLNFRKGNPREVMYEIRGLGSKVSDIIFEL
jgi:hypothetical protein